MAGPGDYTHRYALPRMIVRGVDAVTIDLFVAGPAGSGETLALPATYSLYRGSKALHTTTAITIGVAGVATLTSGIPAASLEDESFSDLLIEEWTVTINALSPEQRTFSRPVYLVRNVIHPVITDVDLTALHSDLSELRDPDQTSFEVQRLDGWIVLQKWLIQKGNRPHLILDDWMLRDVHRFITLHNIFRDFATSVGDGRYSELADQYRERATNEFDRLTFTYDFDEDSRPDAGEIKAGNPVTFLSVPWGWNE